jgi:hypothetical protein
MSRETFWLTDPAHLFTKENWARFVPTDGMTVPEALNAVVRFSVYFSFLLAMVTQNGTYLLFVPVVMVTTVFLQRVYPTTQILKETFAQAQNGTHFSTPTWKNPFMNVLFTDYVDDPQRSAAPPDITAGPIKESVDEAFAQTHDLFMDTSDKYALSQSARQFVTQASTTIPSDLGSFQDFLNKDNVSRKEVSEAYVVAKGTEF